MKTLAIIPARGGSKRLPGKNIKPLLGTPLIAWSIRFARAFPQFDTVLASTDCEDIADACRAEGLNVPWLRPAELATDTASSIDVVKHAIAMEASEDRHYDMVALLQPTSPWRLPKRWDEAFQRLADPTLDAAIGVQPVSNHPFHTFARSDAGGLTPFFEPGALKLRSQDLPPAVVVAGNLYLCRLSALEAEGTFFPRRTEGVLCDEPLEGVDIDTELDWALAEFIAAKYGIEP